MQASIPDCGLGLNLDALPSELRAGQWSDCTNMRFRAGFAEKMKGLTAAFTTPAVVPYGLLTYSTASTRFLVELGIAKVYADDGTTQTEVTRYTEGKQISALTWATSGPNVIDVETATAHGLSTGNTVSLHDCAPAGYNQTLAITVTSATHFTLPYATALTTPATTIGAYSYNVTGDFTGAVDDRWSGGVLNGISILNNAVDSLQYWAGDATIRLRRLPAWTLGWKSDCVRIFKNYIVCLGNTFGGAKKPHNVAWSNAAEPGAIPTTFTAAATNDAGDTDLAETNGQMVDGLPMGDTFVIYKQDARHAMQYIGGNDVFRFSRLPGTDGLLARGCVVDTPVGHVFLTQEKDIKVHTGGEARSIADGRVRTWLKDNINNTHLRRAFLAVNKLFNEVWVCFPTGAGTSCDTVLAWNWLDDTWGKRSVTGVTFGTSGLVASGVAAGGDEQLLLATTTPRIALADTGTTDFGTNYACMLERKGYTFDDPVRVKTLHRSIPQIEATAATAVSIYHGAAQTANAAPTYTSAITFTVGTSVWANGFAKGGRYVAWKLSYTGTSPLRMRSKQMEFNVGGGF